MAQLHNIVNKKWCIEQKWGKINENSESQNLSHNIDCLCNETTWAGLQLVAYLDVPLYPSSPDPLRSTPHTTNLANRRSSSSQFHLNVITFHQSPGFPIFPHPQFGFSGFFAFYFYCTLKNFAFNDTKVHIILKSFSIISIVYLYPNISISINESDVPTFIAGFWHLFSHWNCPDVYTCTSLLIQGWLNVFFLKQVISVSVDIQHGSWALTSFHQQ